MNSSAQRLTSISHSSHSVRYSPSFAQICHWCTDGLPQWQQGIRLIPITVYGFLLPWYMLTCIGLPTFLLYLLFASLSRRLLILVGAKPVVTNML